MVLTAPSVRNRVHSQSGDHILSCDKIMMYVYQLGTIVIYSLFEWAGIMRSICIVWSLSFFGFVIVFVVLTSSEC